MNLPPSPKHLKVLKIVLAAYVHVRLLNDSISDLDIQYVEPGRIYGSKYECKLLMMMNRSLKAMRN